MPLRGLLYFAREYEGWLASRKKDIYRRKLLKIPAPQFYVFYNGKEIRPEREEYHLADAFEHPVKGYDWTAHVININPDNNVSLLKNCSVLAGYTELIHQIRTRKQSGCTIETAVHQAVKHCIENDILKTYLLKNEGEVMSMILTEYDEELHNETLREEGMEKGIEKASRIMMPLLIVLIIGVSIFCITRPGAGAGVKYYLLPDFSRFSATTVLAAMGQLFYSMSLAMGIMITYGSYMKKDSSLEQSVRQIEIFDTVVAFLAGLMIIPSVFVFSGGDEAALGKGPSLMFVTLPKVFESMSFGGVIGAAFFLLVLFAALTSSISLMETNVSIVRDKFGWSRKKSTLIITLYVLILGSIVSLGFGPLSFIKIIGLGLLDFFDFLSNSVLMPIVAILTCVCIGHFIGSKTVEDEVEINGPFKVKKFYRIMLKWIAPICLVLILIFAVSEAMGWIKV